MDKKVKIALFSPLSPIRSGIADYTEELLCELAKYLDIDIYISDDYEPDNQDIKDRFQVYPFDKKSFSPESYDEIVFHMGNDYQPHIYMYEAIKEFNGIVVLHDYVLLGFYAGKYFATGDFAQFSGILKKYYSRTGEEIAEHLAKLLPKPIWDTEEGIEYPLNEEIVAHAKALIVHSEYVRKRILSSWDKPIITIPHHGHRQKAFDTRKIRRDLGLKDDDILIGSFGFINQNKRFHVIIPAICKLNYSRFKYVIIGEDGSHILNNLIDRNSNYVVIKDYVPLEEFEAMISACDICINLRFPTMGETSGSLIRMMGSGKPVIVTNRGYYSELPDHCVFKIDPDIDESETIKRSLIALIQDKDFRESMGREAAKYVKEKCSIANCAKEYADFIQLINSRKNNT